MLPFWRSVNLTGNQTASATVPRTAWFWRSVNLTGNQTTSNSWCSVSLFWRSVNLTGNQTDECAIANAERFGAVSI